MKKISTGSAIFDDFLEGGYETDTITTIYGPAGCGKTLFCILAMINVVKEGKKVIYIDTEGFSVERFKQLDNDYDLILKHVTFLKPTSFEEQLNVFKKINSHVNKDIGLIVVDSIAMLYRLELGNSEKNYSLTNALGLQIQLLSEIARKNNIPVLITNQVYTDISDDSGRVKMMGGNLLKYASKCIIELEKLKGQVRRAKIIKHRSIAETKTLMFEIVKEGIKEK